MKVLGSGKWSSLAPGAPPAGTWACSPRQLQAAASAAPGTVANNRVFCLLSARPDCVFFSLFFFFFFLFSTECLCWVSWAQCPCFPGCTSALSREREREREDGRVEEKSGCSNAAFLILRHWAYLVQGPIQGRAVVLGRVPALCLPGAAERLRAASASSSNCLDAQKTLGPPDAREHTFTAQAALRRRLHLFRRKASSNIQRCHS